MQHTSNDGVRRGDGRNDVLDHSLRQCPRHSLNIELVCSAKRLLVQPLDVIRVIVIQFLVCGNDMSDDKRGKSLDIPLNSFGHSRTLAHSIQCSGIRGVLAIVQMG